MAGESFIECLRALVGPEMNDERFGRSLAILDCWVFRVDNDRMSRATTTLEQRLKRVERELADLKSALRGGQSRRWYRNIVGDFAKDKEFAAIIRLGRLIRKGKLRS